MKKKLNLSPSESAPTPVAPIAQEPKQNEEQSSVSSSIEKRVNEFQEQKEALKPKRKYTRRAKPEEEQKSSEEMQKKERIDGLKRDYAFLGASILEIACKRMPNPIPATDDEKEMFGRCVGNVIAKHSDSLDQWGEETALLVATVVIFFPRIVKEKKEEAKPSMQIPLPLTQETEIP